MMNKIELLSPAGSLACAKVAIDSGADAIYMGGNKFGARAYAKSVEEDSAIDALRYAHKNNKKFYLTVNTLFKQKELKEVFAYLDPFYEENVDAFILQDLGVASIIKNRYNKVSLHASTQMNMTSSKSINLLKKLGFTQFVIARELSLKEIKEIRKEVGDEVILEAFIHGSMCYSYSGTCLMSSFIGGESGNRGRCKGPCRLAYEKNKYILSMKDMSALREMEELIDASINSFKIEGRMRKEDYVESVTKTYRKYIDDIIDKKKNGKSIRSSEKDFSNDEKFLLSIYNKGGFTNYYNKHNDNSMIQYYER